MSRLIPLLASVLLAVAAAAQPPSPVTWSVAAEPAAPQPGGLVSVTVRGEIEPEWRVYAMDSQAGRPLRVEVQAPRVFRALAPPEQTQPQVGFDRWFNSDVTYFTDRVTVTQVFRLADDASGGERRLEARVTFMACNDEVCLPPRTEHLPLGVSIDGPVAAAMPGTDRDDGDAYAGMAAAQAPREEGLSEAESPVPGAAADLGRAGFAVAPPEVGSAGFWAFILLAVGAGLAALLSPCVFPLIPLTVSYFVNQTGDRRRAVRMASVYGLSIVGIFTGLGLAMALLVGAAGPIMIATNPWINLFIGAVLVFFGFSLLGFFELRLPSRWLNHFHNKGNERGGYAGVLFMGLTLTLVSFSCTVPFVGALLAQAVRAEWTYPLIGMLVFSSVFALPFVGFALFPRALQRLPKSGGWMTALKGFLGFLVIAAALQFLANADIVWGIGLLSRTVVIALMIVLFALAGLFLIGRLRLSSAAVDELQVVGPLRLVTAIASFALALYLAPGLLGAPLGVVDTMLPPQRPGAVTLLGAPTAHASDGWLEDREEAFALAQRRGLPVLIDFTGHTCANCRYMEATVLTRPAVVERIREHFVPVKLWTDDLRKGPELQQYQFDLTGRIVLPTYAVVTPEGRLLGQISGITSEANFIAFLDRYRDMAMEQIAAR